MLLSIFLKPPELKDKNHFRVLSDENIPVSVGLPGLRTKKTSFSSTHYGKILRPLLIVIRTRPPRMKFVCLRSTSGTV